MTKKSTVQSLKKVYGFSEVYRINTWKSYLLIWNPYKIGNHPFHFYQNSLFFFNWWFWFFLNYFISYFFSSGFIVDWWYIYASILGISVSMTTNFILNKIFTFRDTNFTLSHVLQQYAFYILFTAIGAGIQLFVLFFCRSRYYISNLTSFWSYGRIHF